MLYTLWLRYDLKGYVFKVREKNICIHFDIHIHTCLIRSASYHQPTWYKGIGFGLLALLWIVGVYTWISALVSLAIYDDDEVFANDIFPVGCFEI